MSAYIVGGHLHGKQQVVNLVSGQDIDVNTMRALEEGLENFAGCAVIISHERWFRERIATHILAFEGKSKVVFYAGNNAEYEAYRKARPGAAADQPHWIKYRHLTQ
jgi:hypothetical protein